ncbi:hypothetical protein [Andreprevotia chitinilytica]|nr:hypothetical protein [Andreprevotia chitinilytica]
MAALPDAGAGLGGQLFFTVADTPQAMTGLAALTALAELAEESL